MPLLPISFTSIELRSLKVNKKHKHIFKSHILTTSYTKNGYRIKQLQKTEIMDSM